MSCTEWRGPIFNNVYNASRDHGPFLHVKLGLVPGFSGGGHSILLHQPNLAKEVVVVGKNR